MRFTSYLQSAVTVLNEYDGKWPFAAWLKEYFRQHKKFGSRDRRIVSDLCFCYFRLGRLALQMEKEDALLRGQFLCHTESRFIQELKPEWTAQQSKTVEQKFNFLQLNDNSLFPIADAISTVIEVPAFLLSHFTQPDLFLRLRPKQKEAVLRKLQGASISFEAEGDCIRLANNTKLDELIELDKEAVVQDRSSQRVLEPLHAFLTRQQFSAWDCCAASGGKTILLHDLFPKAQLTVSDIRESILNNLRNRFRRAGIQQYQSFVADVSSADFRRPKKYDVILCDAPCSGSGTWGRTPEQLVFFNQEKLDHYATLQKKIALHAFNALKPGGTFVYLTCSVYKNENEDVVNHLLQHTSLSLRSSGYVKGYAGKADTLFTALFTL